MFGIFATISVKPGRREAFLAAIKDDALCSVRDEDGCLRFNVFQDASDEHRFYLFEVYRDEAAFEAHRQAPHFGRFFETVDEWSGGPLDIRTAWACYPVSAQYYDQPVPQE